MIDTDKYEKMTWETPSDELEDAIENLLAEVKRLRKLTAFLRRTNKQFKPTYPVWGEEE
jgi:hypothetical protein